MSRWLSVAISPAANSQAATALAFVSSRSSESHVNPSPAECHATPRPRQVFSSPVFQSPLLRNCTTATGQPWATARRIVPKAAVDLPLPSPVFTNTSDGVERSSRRS